MPLIISLSCFFFLRFVICFAEGTYTVVDSADKTKNEVLHILLNKTGYDASIPPSYESGRATDVHIQIAIHDVISENEQKMEFSCLMYVRMNWTDHRLNYSDIANYEVLKVSGSYINRVWIPDIYFHQDWKANFPGFIGKNELIYIGRNGNIRFSGRISTILICRMDLTRYPYDIQHCQMTLQSCYYHYSKKDAYTKEDVQLYWKNENPVMIKDDSVKDYPQWRNRSFGSPCEEPVGNFSTLNTGIQIKRASHSFSQYISTPVVLVSIAMTSFYFGDNFTPRVTLSGASMTTIIMHWAGIYNKIQPAAALIWLDEWMLINLCFVGGIIFFTAIIYHVKHPKEIAEFNHLMEESITVQLKHCKSRWPKWSEIKTWKPDYKTKQMSSSVEEDTPLDNSLDISADKYLSWIIDRRFYAVQNDELRERYYLEFVESMEKKRSRLNPKLFNICRHYSRRFLLDVIAFVVFVLGYICFAAVYVNLWQNKHFSLVND